MKNKFPKINYIGNKEQISNWICKRIPKDVETVFDAFSGGCSFAYEAKRKGYQVHTNDVLYINYLIGISLIENNKITLTEEDTNIIFSGKPKKGFMYKNYTNVHFFEDECMQLDRYRINIEKLKNKFKKSLALILLRRSMIRKMPYSRFNILWKKVIQLRDEEYSYNLYKRKRAYHNKSFKNHFEANLNDYNEAIFDNGNKNKAYYGNIFNNVDKVSADLIYLDPPYPGTMNDYFGFYSLLDNYALSKKTKKFKNNFMDRKLAIEEFDKLFSKLSHFKYWFISYNNQSYPNKTELYSLLKQHSKNVKIIEKDHVYKITGKEKKKKNKEILFVVKN